MKQYDCIHFGDCNLNMECNEFCEYHNKTCFNCANAVSEECGIDGHEIYEDSTPCEEYSEN